MGTPDETTTSAMVENGTSSIGGLPSSSAETSSSTPQKTQQQQQEQYQPSAYEDCVRKVYRINLFHPVKMGLRSIQQLYELLGKPMEKRMVVHVAGSNGKGSVAMKIARTLQYNDPSLKVGLFSSPHVSSFRERMQVNGELISEEETAKLVNRIFTLCEEHNIPATFFEITTAVAFAYYAAHDTDVVVLETGLGGRLDATNAVEEPALAIITSIGLEHTAILGDTVEKIALEKGGIMKPSRPVLVGPNAPHHVLRQCAIDKKAGKYFTCDDVLGKASGEPANGVNAKNDQTFVDYDLENTRIALAGLKLLQRSHSHIIKNIPDEILQRGTSTRPCCRFEEIDHENGIRVVLDVAHNPPAMTYMARKLEATYPRHPFRFVVGMSADKDLKLNGETLLGAAHGDASRIHLVEASNPRAAKIEDILLSTSLSDGALYDLEDRSITKQISAAVELARANREVLVVCGSVFLMADARQALGLSEPRDSPHISEAAGSGINGKYRYKPPKT